MKNVLEYLEYSAEHFPDKIAVTDELGSISYGTLISTSKAAGSALLEEGIKRCSPIPLFMEKGINALTAFFGAVYAGGFYVLLNPDLPDVRIKSILEALKPEIIITDSAHFQRADSISEGLDIRLIDIESLKSHEICFDALSSIRQEMIDTDPLYANFTSGSTGMPKGVLISHRSVLDFIPELVSVSGINDKDILANQAPFDFDVSVKDIYCSLFASASLIIVPKSLFSRPAELLDLLCEGKVTTMIWAVSALCLITAFHGLDYKVPQALKRVMFSGEVMPEKHLKNWMEHLPDTTFINLYGPTEITCNCTYHIIDPSRDYSGRIPIGKAFNNERVFLLDEAGKVVTSPRREGEICVSGTALAIGYYNNPEQTDRAFCQNSSNPFYYERIYHTGDLGYFNECGEYYFTGRKDFQIKHQGHRIELEEIESSIEKTPGVERCCCIYDQGKSRLYAFFVGQSDVSDVLKCASEMLPSYMVPNKLVRLDSFPLTKNGKIDRKELEAFASKRKP